MKTRIKKRVMGITALALLIIFIVAVVAALSLASFVLPVTYSTAKVNMSGVQAGVQVYVSGDGVTRDESGNYTIPSDTKFEVTVINDTAVSTSLTVNGAETQLESSSNFYSGITGSNTQNIEISVVTALSNERGRSLSTAYSISNSSQLLGLSKILASASGDVTATTASIFAQYLGYFGLDNSNWYDENGNLKESYTDEAGTTKVVLTEISSAVNSARSSLSTAYYRLTDDIMVNESTELDNAANFSHGYFGLGSRRGVPFQGVFDFNGYSATMNVQVVEATPSNFIQDGSTDNYILSLGFFNHIYGDGTHACAILDADVRGTIALTAGVDDTTKNYYALVGGIAGSIGEKVVLHNVNSSVSISAQTGGVNGKTDDGVNMYAGGIFGYSGANIDSWSGVSYRGNYSEISITSRNASPTEIVSVGALAGVINNAYVDAFSATLNGANILADAITNGSAIVGGLAGVVQSTSTPFEGVATENVSCTISGVDISASGSNLAASITAEKVSGDTNASLNPDTLNESRGTRIALAGGLIGLAHAEQSASGTAAQIAELTISDIDFTTAAASGALNISASTAEAGSWGIPFAGGVIGYVSSTQGGVVYAPNGIGAAEAVVFSTNVAVTATQNGTGPAYAGGIFGYNTFALNGGEDFTLTEEHYSIEVVAEQSSSSSYGHTGLPQRTDLYDVCAGFYTSVLPDNFGISEFTFTVNNGYVSAQRFSGSTAVGDIAAGAMAGKVHGIGADSNTISGITLNLNSCSVNGLGYSFDSNLYYADDDLNTANSNVSYDWGDHSNNVYVGGFIGYIENYGNYGNGTNSVTYKISDINVNFSGLHENGYTVRGIQNAVSGNRDYCAENYVGGMFGMMNGGTATELHVDGGSVSQTNIYMNGTNNPNTACVGGLIGATRIFQNSSSNSYAVTSSTVTNVHVTGRAFTNIQVGMSGVPSGAGDFDIYVGGAVGVGGAAVSGATHLFEGIVVEDCAVEAVGEEYMRTYAGGVFGGVWYNNTIAVSSCVGRDNSVISSSASYSAYSAGIAGLNSCYGTSYIDDCLVIDSTVEAISYATNQSSYAAGICALNSNGAKIRNNISNAVLNSSGGTSGHYVAGIAFSDDGADSDNDYNYFVAANADAENMENIYAFASLNGSEIDRDSGWLQNPTENYAISLTSSGKSHASGEGNFLSLTQGQQSVSIYNGAEISFSGFADSSQYIVNGSTQEGGNNLQLRIVGDSVTLNQNGTINAVNSGASYAQLWVEHPVDNQFLMLCSYPITVEPAAIAEEIEVKSKDFNEEIISENSHHYFNDGNVTGRVSNGTTNDFSIENGGTPQITLNPPQSFSDRGETFFLISFNYNANTDGTLSINYNNNNVISQNVSSGVGSLVTNQLAYVNNSISFGWRSSQWAWNRSITIYNIKITYFNNSWEVPFEYFQLYAGEDPAISNKTQNVLISTLNTYSPNVYITTNQALLYGYRRDSQGGEILPALSDIENIISGMSAVSLPGVQSYFKATLSDDGKTISVSPILGKTTGAALVLEYETGDNQFYYVIIEVVPNAITGIGVQPAEDTPPRAVIQSGTEGSYIYVYAPGDTVRLEADLTQRFIYNLLVVDVRYTAEGLPSGVNVRPNGTVELGNVSPGSEFTVTCTAINGDAEGYVTIRVANGIVIRSGTLTGAIYTAASNSDAVAGQPYSFYLDPRAGYGLNPTITIKATVNGTVLSGAVSFPVIRTDSDGTADGYYNSSENITIAGQVYTLSYSLDISSGRYTITLPALLTGLSGLSLIEIDASFDKVYSVMFDLGEWAEEPDASAVGTRYFIYQVKSGTEINKQLFTEIYDALGSELFEKVYSRTGFSFKGFYPTNSASSLNAYGTSFYSLCTAGGENDTDDKHGQSVRGSLNYYARWNYTAVVSAPESVTLKSALSEALVETDALGGGLIPIDTTHGFSFVVDGYIGTPRIDVYTVNAAGTALTPVGEDGLMVNGNIFTIADEAITGTLYIFVQPDNISVAATDTDEGSAFGSSLDLRSDGIFTVRYAYNHGAEGAYFGVQPSMLKGNLQFAFGMALPSGTRMRLFWQVNGVPVSVGEYTLTSAAEKVNASSFTSLVGASGMFDYTATADVVSEVYYLVITLPNNQTNLVGNVEVSASVGEDFAYVVKNTEYYTAVLNVNDALVGSGSTDKIDVDETPVQKENTADGEEYFTAPLDEGGSVVVNFFSAVIRSVDVNGSVYTYKVTGGGTEGAPEDLRHSGKYYVWRISGENLSGVQNAIEMDGVYYVVIGDTEINEHTLDLSGIGNVTQVALMEVTNTQFPASGIVLWVNG